MNDSMLPQWDRPLKDTMSDSQQAKERMPPEVSQLPFWNKVWWRKYGTLVQAKHTQFRRGKYKSVSR